MSQAHRLGDFLDDAGAPRLPLRHGGVLFNYALVEADGRITFRARTANPNGGRDVHEVTLHAQDLVVVVDDAIELP